MSGEAASGTAFGLRPYVPADEDAAIALWLRTWQATYPQFDFAARLDWWRARWKSELMVSARIVIAQAQGDNAAAMIGFVTVDPVSLYLDQLVVAPEFWGAGIAAALIAEAKRISPAGLALDVNTDNARALRFYEKSGFVITGGGINAFSGRPVHRMSWRP
ncbi:MAG TPA: GNAT family N-acetyltransferase [Xanthobacteraceae bacterium]|nr:GNAT family N-acetyltransferase [Xanthobacteraceae bacterium]